MNIKAVSPRKDIPVNLEMLGFRLFQSTQRNYAIRGIDQQLDVVRRS
ncbi:hypothetical protein PZH36_00190 [Ruminococcus bromii]|nr:hypothetical protein [Ruminococcus bromii]MDE8725554.1 hypothetical protein [Ruminococcus bromii]